MNQKNQSKSFRSNFQISICHNNLTSAFIIYIFFLLSFQLYGQSGHSNKIDWKTLGNNDVRIIYPEMFKQDAQRVLAFIDRANQRFSDSLNFNIRPINIVLRGQTVIPNGYVGLGPWRSEFFMTPPQDQNFTGTGNWMDVLSIHEYRHVQQANYSNRSLVKVFHYLFGQAGWAIGKTIAVPNWFSEGDAVMAETKFTLNGRGRNPQFFALQRAILEEKGLPKFSLARNGSFKRVLPNHYLLGYTMCNYLESAFGTNVWARVLAKSASMPLFHPFKKSIENTTGLNFTDLYTSSFETLNHSFDEKMLPNQQQFTRLTKESKNPTFYEFPFYYNDDLYALKTSYNQIPQIVKINLEKDSVLAHPGITQEAFLSANENFICWTQFSRNPRFIYQEYSDIVLMDLKTSKEKIITHKGKYFSPHANRDGSKIVAVYRDSILKISLRIINAQNGAVLNDILFEKLENISFPRWLDEEHVVFAAQEKSMISLVKYNVRTNKLMILIGPSRHTINQINVYGDEIIFSSSASGIDNIFLLNSKNQIFICSNSKTGMYTPVKHNDTIVSSEIHANGSPLISFTPILETFEIKKDAETILPKTGPDLQDDSSDITISTRGQEGNFSRTGGFQLHSYVLNPDNVTPSVQLFYENLLGNIIGETTLLYNINEQKPLWQAGISLSSTYPVFGVNTSAGKRRSPLLKSDGKLENAEFREVNLGTDITVPLRYIRGNYSTTFNPLLRLQYKYISQVSTIFPLASDPTFFNLGIGFTLRNLKRTAYQNIRTKWGQELSINVQKGVTKLSTGWLNARGALYFPGIGKNHSIKIDVQYKQEDITNDYKYADNFQYHRGGTRFAASKARRASFEYMLPIIYPDFGWFDLIYFKRVSANFFADIAQYSVEDRKQKAYSLGTEIYFDNVHYNEYPINYGFRISHPIDNFVNQPIVFEALFGALF